MPKYHVAIWGASGNLGREVCLAFADLSERRMLEDGYRILLAGRDGTRLMDVYNRLVTLRPEAHKLFVIMATDTEFSVAKSARVVISCVRSYHIQGEGMVQACLAAGSHYVDASVDILYVRNMIRRHDESAKKAGITILPGCGADSALSDLAFWRGSNHLFKSTGDSVVRMAGYVEAVAPRDETFPWYYMPRIPGGSVLSAFTRPLTDKEQADVRYPYTLCAIRPRYRLVRNGDDDPLFPSHDFVAGMWSGPRLLSTFSSRYVRWSASHIQELIRTAEDYPAVDDPAKQADRAALPSAVSENFQYNEYAADRDLIRLICLCAMWYLFTFAVQSLMREWIIPYLPQPGTTKDGVDPLRRRYILESSSGKLLSIEISPLDSIRATAIVLACSGNALATGPVSESGVLTVSHGLGGYLLTQLESMGFVFKVELCGSK